MSDILQTKLFDKIINVKLFAVGSNVVAGETVTLGNGQIAVLSSYIQCPRTGRKPSINFRGKILPSPILSDLELRITNLYTGDVPLDAYKYLRIEAGYAGALSSSVEGEVVNAYQETPGPDGVTVFVMLLGFFTNWSNITRTLQWPSGTKINAILSECAVALGMTLKSFISDALLSQVSYSFTGLVSRFLSDLASGLGINIFPDSGLLKAFEKAGSTDKHHVMRFFINAPKHEAYGYNLTAPWNPDIRPGDILDIDTRFVRQTFGGAQVGSQNTAFVAQTVSFDFSTTDDTNSMTIIATAAG
jgi:hypothetical protein